VIRLQEEQQKRIMPKFNDNENIKSDKNIARYIRELTENIKTSEENIRIISFSEVKQPSEAPGIIKRLLNSKGKHESLFNNKT